MTGATGNFSTFVSRRAAPFLPYKARLGLLVKRRPPPPGVSEPSPRWRLFPPLSWCLVLAFRWS